MKKVFIKSYGCQMNVYDSQRMSDVLAAAGYARGCRRSRGRSGYTEHLPHPGKSGREGLLGAWPAQAPQDQQGKNGRTALDRRRWLRGPGRRAGARRPRPGRRSGLRTSVLPSPSRASWPPGRTTSLSSRLPTPPKTSLPHSHPRHGTGRGPRRFSVRNHSGRLRPVLLVLRCSLHPRRRVLAACQPSRSRSSPTCRRRGARGNPARPERQRLPRLRAIRQAVVAWPPARSPVDHRGDRTAALHDEPSSRHGR